MKYTITQSPLTPELIADIYKEFDRHAITTIGFDGFSHDPIAFEIHNNGSMIGVCGVQLFWGSINIRYLLVREEYRRQGIGQQLIEHALKFGKEQGCKVAFVITMSFQAPEFYEKLGFTIQFKLEGYAHDVSLYFLRKDL